MMSTGHSPPEIRFRAARRGALVEQVVAQLTRRPARLLCYDEVCDLIEDKSSHDVERREIPVEAIAGSVGRCAEYTRGFRPRLDSDLVRWTDIESAFAASKRLPLVSVYQVGQIYFVVDGNHRVSVARQRGITHIQAHVIQIQTRVPFSPDIQPGDLDLAREYAAFLAHTNLGAIRPQANFWVTAPGQYAALEQQIAAHHTFLKVDLGRAVPDHEAVASWYDNVYRPLAEQIQNCGLQRDFPGRTLTDLYLWLCTHRQSLEEILDVDVDLETAAADLARRFSPRPRRILSRACAWLLKAVPLGRLSPSRA